MRKFLMLVVLLSFGYHSMSLGEDGCYERPKAEVCSVETAKAVADFIYKKPEILEAFKRANIFPSDVTQDYVVRILMQQTEETNDEDSNLTEDGFRPILAKMIAFLKKYSNDSIKIMRWAFELEKVDRSYEISLEDAKKILDHPCFPEKYKKVTDLKSTLGLNDVNSFVQTLIGNSSNPIVDVIHIKIWLDEFKNHHKKIEDGVESDHISSTEPSIRILEKTLDFYNRFNTAMYPQLYKE